MKKNKPIKIKTLGDHIKLKYGSVLKLIFAGHDNNKKGAYNEEYKIYEFTEALKIIDCMLYRIKNCNIDNGFYFPQKISEFNNLTQKVSFINNVCKDEAIKIGNIKVIAIEIHFNSSIIGNVYEISGIETLYCTGSNNGRMLAKRIQESLIEKLPFRDRKIKSRNDLYFLNKTIPTAIIPEILFINNNLETSYLFQPRGRLLIAQSIFNGIIEYEKIINKRNK